MHTAFEVHVLNDAGIQKAKNIAILFDDLLTNLEPSLGGGRERSIVITKLEEAAYFAKKTVANQKENQREA